MTCYVSIDCQLFRLSNIVRISNCPSVFAMVTTYIAHAINSMSHAANYQQFRAAGATHACFYLL